MFSCGCFDYRLQTCVVAKRYCNGYKKEYNRNYHLKNKESILKRKQTYHYQNKEKRTEQARIWNSNRRARKLKATFGNEELNNLVFKEAYTLAKLREKCTNIPYEVDHIIPLKGKVVCGFHTWNNVRVIPKSLNRLKGNKLMENI